jgi:hypothetical protein
MTTEAAVQEEVTVTPLPNVGFHQIYDRCGQCDTSAIENRTIGDAAVVFDDRMNHSGQLNAPQWSWASASAVLGLITMKDQSPFRSQREQQREFDEMAPARGAVWGSIFGVCAWAVAFACWKCVA